MSKENKPTEEQERIYRELVEAGKSIKPERSNILDERIKQEDEEREDYLAELDRISRETHI